MYIYIYIYAYQKTEKERCPHTLNICIGSNVYLHVSPNDVSLRKFMIKMCSLMHIYSCVTISYCNENLQIKKHIRSYLPVLGPSQTLSAKSVDLIRKKRIGKTSAQKIMPFN